MGTRIANIPCQVLITCYYPARPANFRGYPDRWTPPETEEILFQVLEGAPDMSISTTLHEVRSITLSKPTDLGMVVDRVSYCRTLKVVTESGTTFKLTLFSPDQGSLAVLEEH